MSVLFGYPTMWSTVDNSTSSTASTSTDPSPAVEEYKWDRKIKDIESMLSCLMSDDDSAATTTATNLHPTADDSKKEEEKDICFYLNYIMDHDFDEELNRSVDLEWEGSERADSPIPDFDAEIPCLTVVTEGTEEPEFAGPFEMHSIIMEKEEIPEELCGFEDQVRQRRCRAYQQLFHAEPPKVSFFYGPEYPQKINYRVHNDA